MELDLREISRKENSEMPIDLSVDLSGEEIDGIFPLKKPVTLKGVIKNSADVLKLNAVLNAFYLKPCDRCCEETEQQITLNIKRVFVTQEENENDDYILVPLLKFNVDEFLRSEIILNLPTLHLCSPDCLGICPVCGKNLNKFKCDCPK